MQATATERPAAGDAVAAIDDHRIAERAKCACCSDQRVAAVDFSCRLGRQIAAERAILAVDRRAPAHRAVGLRDLLYDANERRRVGFLATERTWNPQSKQAGTRHRFDQSQRQAPFTLDLIGARLDLRRQPPGGIDKGYRRRTGH